jgi:hypothetical protein
MPDAGTASSAEAWNSVSKAALKRLEVPDQKHVAEYKDSNSLEEVISKIKS